MNQTQSNQDVNANSRGSLLKEMEVDSDSELPEFSLPPKSVVKRPRKSIKKRYIYSICAAAIITKFLYKY